MPFIIRIILQRTIIGMTTVLTFLGIAPEAQIPTTEQAIIAIEQRQEDIGKMVEANTEATTPEDIIAKIDEAAEKKTEIIPEKTSKIIKPNIFQPKPENPVLTIPVTAPPVVPSKVEENKSIAPVINMPEVKKFVVETIAPQVASEKTSFTKIEDVVVNIICTSSKGNFTSAQTGSGVIISPIGVVLTNAHVAHPFLLKDQNCALYQKNNTYFGYKATPIYIQAEWLQRNKDIATNPNPKGTGEDDYALLFITENTNPGGYLPSKFPYAEIQLDKDFYEVGQNISVGGFPGAPATLLDLARAGNLKTDDTTISDVFTFKNNSIDVISTGSTPVAARGASGGGVFNNNNLVAITVTTSGSGNSARINAITTTYIDGDMRDDIGIGITSFISGDLKTRATNFIKNDLAGLASILNQ